MWTHADSSDLGRVSANSCDPLIWVRGLTLIACRAIEHAVDLQDVTVAVVAVELVPRPVEAQYNLVGLASRWPPWVVLPLTVHPRGRSRWNMV